MSDLKEFVAIQDFTMSLDNGKTPIYVKKGETLSFDGLNVVFRGEKGTARPLSKVVGEWISPIGTPVKPVGKQLSRPSSNATGGKEIEHSDYPSDPASGVKNPPSDSLKTLVAEYEKPVPIKLVNGKREVTSDLEDIKKEVTVINDDANEVRKITANDGAKIANKNSVEIAASADSKSVTMSTEGQVAKATNYSGKEAGTEERKKLAIDYEASGVVVKETTKTGKVAVAKSPAKMETVDTDIDMGETSYPSTQTTDVGSSTQAQVEQRKSPAKKAPVKKTAAKKGTAKKAPVKKAPVKKAASAAPKVLSTAPTVVKGPTVSVDGQEAVVIGKVTRDSSKVMSEDGIVSRVTVGALDEGNNGDVTFSSNNDFEEPTATFSPGEDTVYDATVTDDDIGVDLGDLVDSMADTEATEEAGADDDIDLNALLSEDA